MNNPGKLIPMFLLPGAYMRAGDFAAHGFDGIPLETGMEPYLDGSIVERLHAAIAPTRPVWLAGISLGGMGALLYAKAHPEAVAGLLLLSPFIGTRGTVAEVIQAGGFDSWEPPSGDAATEDHLLLQWLKSCRGRLNIHLGYGESDRYAASFRLLADLLPAERVMSVAGGHDWATWKILWDRLLPCVG